MYIIIKYQNNMGIKYVMIDSKHQRHHIDERGTTKIQVKLNQPTEHAITVELSSFSTANELYNVKTGENTFSFIVYNLSIASPTIKVYTFGVIPGMYTISELVDACNVQISGSDFTSVTVTKLLLSNNIGCIIR
jgi:UDP-N-acetylmuramate-alanine ligase